MLNIDFWDGIFKRVGKYYKQPIHPGDKSVIIDICSGLNKKDIYNIFKKIIDERETNEYFPPPFLFKKVKQQLLKEIKDCGFCENGYVACKQRDAGDLLDPRTYKIEFYCNCDLGELYNKNNLDEKLKQWSDIFSEKLIRRKESLMNNFSNDKEITTYLKEYYLNDLSIKVDKFEKRNFTAKQASFFLKSTLDFIKKNT